MGGLGGLVEWVGLGVAGMGECKECKKGPQLGPFRMGNLAVLLFDALDGAPKRLNQHRFSSSPNLVWVWLGTVKGMR